MPARIFFIVEEQPNMALANASAKVRPIPITSPVERISGPKIDQHQGIY